MINRHSGGTSEYWKHRILLDEEYHGVFDWTSAEIQNDIVSDLLSDTTSQEMLQSSKNENDMKNPWIVFSAGPMGAGKSTVMRWLSQHGFLPSQQALLVDMDIIRTKLPAYTHSSHDSLSDEDKIQKTQREAGCIAELCTHAALSQGRSVCVDGSMQDRAWQTHYITMLRDLYPEARILLVHVTAPLEVVHQRAADRPGRSADPAAVSRSHQQVHSFESFAGICSLVDLAISVDTAQHSEINAFPTDFPAVIVQPANVSWSHLREILTTPPPSQSDSLPAVFTHSISPHAHSLPSITPPSVIGTRSGLVVPQPTLALPMLKFLTDDDFESTLFEESEGEGEEQEKHLHHSTSRRGSKSEKAIQVSASTVRYVPSSRRPGAYVFDDVPDSPACSVHNIKKWSPQKHRKSQKELIASRSSLESHQTTVQSKEKAQHFPPLVLVTDSLNVFSSSDTLDEVVQSAKRSEKRKKHGLPTTGPCLSTLSAAAVTGVTSVESEGEEDELSMELNVVLRSAATVVPSHSLLVPSAAPGPSLRVSASPRHLRTAGSSSGKTTLTNSLARRSGRTTAASSLSKSEQGWYTHGPLAEEARRCQGRDNREHNEEGKRVNGAAESLRRGLRRELGETVTQEESDGEQQYESEMLSWFGPEDRYRYYYEDYPSDTEECGERHREKWLSDQYTLHQFDQQVTEEEVEVLDAAEYSLRSHPQPREQLLLIQEDASSADLTRSSTDTTLSEGQTTTSSSLNSFHSSDSAADKDIHDTKQSRRVAGCTDSPTRRRKDARCRQGRPCVPEGSYLASNTDSTTTIAEENGNNRDTLLLVGGLLQRLDNDIEEILMTKQQREEQEDPPCVVEDNEGHHPRGATTQEYNWVTATTTAGDVTLTAPWSATVGAVISTLSRSTFSESCAAAMSAVSPVSVCVPRGVLPVKYFTAPDAARLTTSDECETDYVHSIHTHNGKSNSSPPPSRLVQSCSDLRSILRECRTEDPKVVETDSMHLNAASSFQSPSSTFTAITQNAAAAAAAGAVGRCRSCSLDGLKRGRSGCQGVPARRFNKNHFQHNTDSNRSSFPTLPLVTCTETMESCVTSELLFM